MTSGDPVFRRILVPTDFSAQSEEAWRVARRLAAAVGAELVLLHVVVETPLFSEGPFTGERVREVYESARAWGTAKLAEWTRAAGDLAVTARVRTGAPHAEILAAAVAEHADLVVIGTHGRGGVERALMGSVADRVIRLASCPVLAVRAHGET
jgi:nucleotide-binding universal stress UspA family protein